MRLKKAEHSIVTVGRNLLTRYAVGVSGIEHHFERHVRALHRGDERPRVRRMIERPTRAAGLEPLTDREMAETLTDPNRAS